MLFSGLDLQKFENLYGFLEKSPKPPYFWLFGVVSYARKKTRTSIPLKALVPETSVSTNSTIRACSDSMLF